MQVKRTDELSRKMRFFTDQVEKSGVITGARSGSVDPLNMDELEVCLNLICYPVSFTWCRLLCKTLHMQDSPQSNMKI